MQLAPIPTSKPCTVSPCGIIPLLLNANKSAM
jgi:hypothetical protein